jgi:hypothetical protein
MGDHEFFGTVSASSAAVNADELMRKQEVDSQSTQDRDRANHTGTQLMATISDRQTYVDGRIALVIDAAPSALDTLNEIAAALGDDPNYAATVTTALGALDSRIDALEAGAGTSSYKANIGDGSLSLYTVTHNLGTRDVMVSVQRVSDWQQVNPVIKAATTNTITVDFGAFVPASNTYRVMVKPF